MPKTTLPDNAICIFQWKIFSLYQWEQEMFDWQKKIFEKAKRADTIDVIAITKDERIVIIEEQQPWRDICYGFVGWTCEPHEIPLQTAQRELIEETWMQSENWKLFNSYSISSKIDYQSHIFIARNCEVLQQQQLDVWGEKITLHYFNWDQFIDFVASDRCKVQEFAWDVLRMIYHWKEKELKELILGKS
jgi:8-oxo-dGTP pyrophosphatase MutT (NUDIX family)